MTLIENLEAIDKCKQDIKTALKNKGVEMEGVVFEKYAEKIDALQLESGNTPTPTPSADYIYSNGYLTNGTETNEIVNLVPYEIKLDDENKCSFELTCPVEYKVYEGSFYDIKFVVEVPEKYDIIKCVWLNEANNNEEMPQDLKDNPRYDGGTVVRNGIVYKSKVRVTEDGLDKKSKKLYTAPVKHIITIQEK